MKYFIKTYGCQMNESDSERIASFLEKKGYEPVKGADSSAEALAKADLIVVNACSVRQSAIDRIFGLETKFKKLRTSNSKLRTILTGCVLKSDKKKFEEFFDLIISIKEFFLSPFFHDRKKKETDYLKIKPKYLYENSAFVPIMTGCDNFCAYCVVPHTRGREISRPTQEIINEVRNLIKQGYKEITLLGQNVNSYQYGFSKLLKKLNALPGNFKIYFLTSHPKDMSDELLETIAKCKKVAKEIHLPVQSGDDKILKKMNRGYTVKQYKNLIKKIRQKIPKITISTDVIVGFSGETKKRFENTVKLFKEIKFDKAYINKYSPRAGAAAYKLKDNVSWQEKKRRWKILNEIVRSSSRADPPASAARRADKPKLIVILGPTASGKSIFAVKLAKEFGGEIISADSRQIYKGMDIGTGKITPDTNPPLADSTGQVKKKYIFTHKGIPHHMLDIVSPKTQLTVAQYRKKALEVIEKIYSPRPKGRGKTPILCGGTGFYIQAVAEGIIIPEIKPDQKLRKALEKQTTEILFEKLKKLDPGRAKNIDSKNRRRLIRALEIVLKTGKPVPSLEKQAQFNILYIGVKKTLSELKKLIDQRVEKMIKMGLENEVKNLVKKYGWTTVLKNAIGYQEFKDYFNKITSLKDVINAIKVHTYQFAKRQMTWFRQNPAPEQARYGAGKKINWVNPRTKVGFNKILRLCKKFLRKDQNK